MMDSFITKDGKKLRRGYTTGSCAAAAAKAAAVMLLENRTLDTVFLTTPAGIGLTLALRGTEIGDGWVSCGVVKDSGDDPDATNGITVYARVEKTGFSHQISIDGGEGIGRVTKPGLDQPVGNAAINSVPRRMITEELMSVCADCGYDGGLGVTIYAPEGTETAKRTFNPRLGIEGGISILGTTGIVEPMSDQAVVETIRAELSLRAAECKTSVLLTPGNYGADFIKKELRLPAEAAVMTSNFIGDALYLASEAGFSYALLVGHIGKLVKLAGGIFNTHSRWGDCRADIFAAHAGMCGASSGVIRGIMDSAVTDEMLRLLDEAGLRERVMDSIMKKTGSNISAGTTGPMTAGAIAFSGTYCILGATERAEELLKIIQEEYGA